MPGYEIIGDEEKTAVNEVFDKGACLFRYGFESMRQGLYKVVEFEKEFANYLHARYAHAVTSGTAALFVLNKVLGIGKNDEVITQSFTFVATVEAILEAGATPVICEIDETLNMDPKDLENKITKRTKAICVVHMMGVPARMREILKIARKYNIPVIEDTAQALGAKVERKFCGTLGIAGAFSFDFGKTLTTGEGGMIVTNNKNLYLKAKAYSDHGHEDNPKFPRGEDTASFSGFNFRMMELQGAIGLAQLRKLPHALFKIRSNYLMLRKLLSGISDINFREIPKNCEIVGDTLVFFLDSKRRKEKVAEYLVSKGLTFKLLPGAVKWHFAGRWNHILCQVERYKNKNYLKLWPKSYQLLQRAIALPIMIQMPREKIRFMAKAVKEAVLL